jgi:hypothetical protein
MSKSRRQLSVNRETVRDLTNPDQLRQAAGGFITLFETCNAICQDVSRIAFPCLTFDTSPCTGIVTKVDSKIIC